MKKALFIDHNHASMLNTVLKCPACRAERVVANGVSIHNGQTIQFYACLCPIPAGVMVRRPR